MITALARTCVALAGLILTASVHADDIRYERHAVRLAVAIEKEQRPVNLYVMFDERAVSQPIETFAADTPPASAERALSSFIDAVRANNGAELQKAVEGGAASVKAAESLADALRQAGLTAGARASVVRQIAVGDAVMFAVDVTGPKHPPLLIFVFTRGNDGYLCSLKSVSNPVVQNLMVWCRAAQSRPDEFKAVPAHVLKGLDTVEIGDPFGQSVSAHTVEFSYKAVRMDYQVALAAAAKPAGEQAALPEGARQLVAVYADWLTALASRDWEHATALLAGPTSRSNFADMIGDRPRADTVAFQASVIRYVKCLLDLDDLQVLIYDQAKGPYAPKVLNYDLLCRGGDGQYRTANLGQIGPLNGLLAWEPFASQVIEHSVRGTASK